MSPDNNFSVAKSSGHLAGLAKWLLGDLPQDIFGLAGADWLRELRIRNLSRLMERTEEKLKERGVADGDRRIDPSFVLSLFIAAQDSCYQDDILELWSRLLASALDPATASQARKGYLQLVEKFDHIDARVINFIWNIDRKGTGTERVRALTVAEATGLRYFDVRISFAHLESLKCVFLDHDHEKGDITAQCVDIGNALYEALRSPNEVNDPENKTES